MKRIAPALALTLALATLLAGCSKPLPEVEPLSGGSPKKGRQLIERYGCAACHRIKGIDHATSRVGPSLEEIRDQGYVGGVLPNNADNMAKWIAHPTRYSSNTAMPDLGVSEAEARDMAAYLYSQ